MKKHKVLIVLGFLLVSCNPEIIDNSSTIQSNFDSTSSLSSSSINSSVSEFESSSSLSDNSMSTQKISFNLPTSNTQSNDSLIANSSANSSEIYIDNSVKESDFLASLLEANSNDNNIKSLNVTTYEMSTKTYGNYDKSNYTMTAYSDNVTIYSGTQTKRESSSLVSKFKLQKAYKDGYYTEIKKFDDIFRNTSYKKEMTSDNADKLLEIGHSNMAYNVIKEFKTNYTMTYEGYYEDNVKHCSYSYFDNDSLDNNNYIFCALIDVIIDENNYLKKFIYSEGYYDAWYINDGVSKLSTHIASIGKGGYIYEMSNPIIEQRTAYGSELLFPLNDNFINSISFVNTEINISLKDIKADQYNRKSIYLLDYIITDPISGERDGAPVNNITFTSSNPNIASVGDQFYLDFNSTGEVEITASDSSNGINSSNTMKIIISE